MAGLKSNREYSFRHKLEEEGWTREQLMKFYDISTIEKYDRIIASLEEIKPLQIKAKGK